MQRFVILWRSSSGRPADGRGLSSSSGGHLWPSGSVYPLAVIIRKACRWTRPFCHDLKACRWMRRFVILWRSSLAVWICLPSGGHLPEGLPMDAAFLSAEGLPVDAAFRHPWRSSLAVWICLPSGGHLPEGLPVDAAFYYPLKACRWTRPFVIGRGLSSSMATA